MKIITTKRKTRTVLEFERNEWQVADKEHYGIDVASDEFEGKPFYVTAYEGDAIVGVLTLSIRALVVSIDTLIVAKNKRGLGIGKALMKEAEQLAKAHHAHKIYLLTGKSWDAVHFYTARGYKITGELPNHYFHEDFVELTKYL